MEKSIKLFLDENKLIATKISDNWNYAIIGDKTLPKNSVVSWKIKIKNPGKYCNIMIGICPENLNQNMPYIFRYCWTFDCNSSNLFLMNNIGTPYNTGRLKTNDIVEVKVDTTNCILSFAVNGVDYDVAYFNIPNVNLCPVVCMYNTGSSIELIE